MHKSSIKYVVMLRLAKQSVFISRLLRKTVFRSVTARNNALKFHAYNRF